MLSRLTNSVVSPRVIMHTSEPSGLGHYVSKLVVALARSGVSVVLFCPANSNDEKEVRAAGVEVVHAAWRDVSKAGLLARLLRNFKFLAKTMLIQSRLVRRGDIVHFQGTLHLPLGLVFFLLAILRGGSIVLTAHDPMPHRWRFPRGLRWLERRMLQRSYRLSERIIVHNEAGKDVLVRQFRQQANRVSVIPHGLYLNASEGDTYPAFECLRLLAFGSIRENKGLHLAIRAVQTLPPDFHIPVHLTIAGGIQNSSAERYWQTCKQMIATKPDGIEVIEGHVDDDKIGPLLARHHAVLLPYTDFYSESGVANLALSHQRPILATAAGGLGKLVESGVCGVPIATPSAESVAQAIVVALELGRERLRQMGIEGSEFMQRTRSWDSIARQTAELYAQLSMDQTVLEHGSRAPVQSWTDNTTKTKEYI